MAHCFRWWAKRIVGVIEAAAFRWEYSAASTLEQRVRQAIQDPSSVDRFGGWSLGESMHLINDAWLFDGVAPAEPQAKRAKPKSAKK